MDGKTPTYGGYSTHIVVEERFVLKVPAKLDPGGRGAAPLRGDHHLLAAHASGRRRRASASAWSGSAVSGTWGSSSPRRMGAEVTRPQHVAIEGADAKRLGAHHFVATSETRAVRRARGPLRLHPRHRLGAARLQRAPRRCSAATARWSLVGAPPEPTPSAGVLAHHAADGASPARSIGGIAETQEMLDFCGKHEIISDIEVIPIQKINRPTSGCSRRRALPLRHRHRDPLR